MRDDEKIYLQYRRGNVKLFNSQKWSYDEKIKKDELLENDSIIIIEDTVRRNELKESMVELRKITNWELVKDIFLVVELNGNEDWRCKNHTNQQYEL